MCKAKEHNTSDITTHGEPSKSGGKMPGNISPTGEGPEDELAAEGVQEVQKPRLVHSADVKPAETEAERAAREAAEEDADEREFQAQRRDLPNASGASVAGIVGITTSKLPAGKNEFFRTNPTFSPIVDLVVNEVGMERQYYTATENMKVALAGIGITMAAHTLYFTISETGAFRAVPIRTPDEEGNQNEYDRTKEVGLLRGMEEWVRVYTDLKNKQYRVYPADKDPQTGKSKYADPVFPALKHSKIFRLLFADRGHKIDSPQHPMYLKWAGRASNDKNKK
jgi:hypothetical protein